MVKKAEKKRRVNPLLPMFGAVLAVIFAFFAFLLKDPARSFLVSRRVDFGGMPSNTVDLLIAVTIWLVLFGTAMFIVAMMVGRSVDEKQAISFYKQEAKDRKRRQKEKKYRRR